MESTETKRELSSRLAAAGFDFTRPDPLVALHAFKDFAREPVTCEDDGLLWQFIGPRFRELRLSRIDAR